MKIYQHTIIIASLVLFTIFFYKEGYGAISFLLAACYLIVLFINEIRRERKRNEL